jgi:hypothetical protein
MAEMDNDIVDAPKEFNDVGSDAMLVEETKDSLSFTQANEVIAIFFTHVPVR